MFGWSREEAIGQPLADTIIPAQHRDAHRRGLKHFLATGEGPVLNRVIEITAVRRSGVEFPVELTISPLTVGRKYVFTAFLRDITQRKEAEDKLKRQVEFVIASGLEISVDLRLFRLVLENLLGNAWKYTAKHPRARIEFGVTQHEARLAYYVRDDGAGFDMTYADKLFVAFQRLHAPGEFEGTGVGLATVRRIISRHGGRVWAEGAVERGATLYLTV